MKHLALILITLLMALLPIQAAQPAVAAEPPPATPPKKVSAQAWQTAQAAGVVNIILTAPGYPDLSPAAGMPLNATEPRRSDHPGYGRSRCDS